MREKTKADLVAEHMVGKGWFRSADVRKFLVSSSPTAIQVTQQLRTIKKYTTIERKEKGAVYIKVLDITYETPPALRLRPSRERKLWYSAIFGRPVEEQA